MKRVIRFLGVLNWFLAVALLVAPGTLNGILKLQVMSSFHQMRENGVINEEKLATVGWDRLAGNEQQRPAEYFLGDAMRTYTFIIWGAALIMTVNGVFLFAVKGRRAGMNC